MLLLEKIDEEGNNLDCTFRLKDTEDVEFEAYFERKNFREVLFGRGYSPHRVGSVLRMMNIRFPIEISSRRCMQTEYKEDEMIDYLRALGFKVYKDLEMKADKIVNILVERGYVVERNDPGQDFFPKSKN